MRGEEGEWRRCGVTDRRRGGVREGEKRREEKLGTKREGEDGR